MQGCWLFEGHKAPGNCRDFFPKLSPKLALVMDKKSEKEGKGQGLSVCSAPLAKYSEAEKCSFCSSNLGGFVIRKQTAGLPHQDSVALAVDK